MKASNNKEEEPHFVKRDKFAITAENISNGLPISNLVCETVR